MQDIVAQSIRTTVEKLTKAKDERYIGLKTQVRQAIECLQIAMFPSYVGQDLGICRNCPDTGSCRESSDSERRTAAFEKAADCLVNSISRFTSFKQACDMTASLIDRIPEVAALLESDIEAAYEGDPAASSLDEIILAYPAFQAICIYRIAHVLLEIGVPTIPRMMTEYAHEITGIDIHPGATVGRSFFIDHGTGVVIGETTTIGDNVKIYQHVTLGAKSQKSMVKGNKRHPDIGNNVVIYAGATILGGDVRIGDNCVIGGNVWLTHSVEANMTVSTTPAELRLH